MQYRYRLSRICTLVVTLAFVAGCSHLHVDTLDAWTPQEIDTVVYSIADAPASKADILVREQIRALGWELVDTRNQADSVVECEFVYKADLSSEGKRTRTLESVHVRIQDIPTGGTQAVSDYFYAHGKEDEWEEGIATVFAGLNSDKQAQKSQKSKNSVVQAPTQIDAQPTQPTQPTQVIAYPASVETNDIPVSQRTRQQPESVREPESLEKSPWVPRFQGWGLEAWGVEE